MSRGTEESTAAGESEDPETTLSNFQASLEASRVLRFLSVVDAVSGAGSSTRQSEHATESTDGQRRHGSLRRYAATSVVCTAAGTLRRWAGVSVTGRALRRLSDAAETSAVVGWLGARPTPGRMTLHFESILATRPLVWGWSTLTASLTDSWAQSRTRTVVGSVVGVVEYGDRLVDCYGSVIAVPPLDGDQADDDEE